LSSFTSLIPKLLLRNISLKLPGTGNNREFFGNNSNGSFKDVLKI
jgi:hypothetical protein